MTISWPTNIQDAQRIQQQLRQLVVLEDTGGPIKTVAGVDAGYDGDQARAVVVVLAYPSLAPLDYAVALRPTPLPYIPGFLSFREGPAVLAALEGLRVRPDMLIFDGQGIAHPRRLGIASHIGVLTDTPAIGCAKSLLVGQFWDLPDERGAWVPLRDRGETIGAALRTRAGTRPVFISAGHRVTLERSIELVMGCTTRYRLPETTRAADGLASHGRIPMIAPSTAPDQSDQPGQPEPIEGTHE